MVSLSPILGFNVSIFISVDMTCADFDRAVTLLETKLGARIGGDANVSASAKFARFNLGTNIQNNGVSTAGSVLFGRANTPGDHGSNSSVSGKSVFSKQPTFRAFSHHSHRDDQHVSTTALYYRDVEEQLADTLYKRAQAKLIVDPNPANITAALDDALKVVSQSTYRSIDSHSVGNNACGRRR